MFRLKRNQHEYIDHRGVHVVVGHYIGDGGNSKIPSNTNGKRDIGTCLQQLTVKMVGNFKERSKMLDVQCGHEASPVDKCQLSPSCAKFAKPVTRQFSFLMNTYGLINIVFFLVTINTNNFSPVAREGRNGNPVVIPSKDILRMQQLFQINRFNLLASDRIPLNRTLPDVRKKR